MLHLVFTHNQAQQVLAFIKESDAVVFLENSTLRLNNKALFSRALTPWVNQVKFYVLAPDIQLRGIDSQALSPHIDIIDYAELVALTQQHEVIKTWS